MGRLNTLGLARNVLLPHYSLTQRSPPEDWWRKCSLFKLQAVQLIVHCVWRGEWSESWICINHCDWRNRNQISEKRKTYILKGKHNIREEASGWNNRNEYSMQIFMSHIGVWSGQIFMSWWGAFTTKEAPNHQLNRMIDPSCVIILFTQPSGADTMGYEWHGHRVRDQGCAWTI